MFNYIILSGDICSSISTGAISVEKATVWYNGIRLQGGVLRAVQLDRH